MTEPTDPDKLQSADDVAPDAQNEDQGETPLMEAARWGYIEDVRQLITSGADVNLKTYENWTALHAACVGGHGEIIDLLLSHGADPNVYSHHQGFDEDLGWNYAGTPLHVAAANGKVKVAEQLLAKGALVDESLVLDWRTALIYAAAYGHAEVIALLCKHGANPNCREHSHESGYFFDNTPLHYAARNGHVEAVKVLLSCRAEPRAVEAYSGHTALQMARASKRQDVMKVLREQKK